MHYNKDTKERMWCSNEICTQPFQEIKREGESDVQLKTKIKRKGVSDVSINKKHKLKIDN